MKKLILNVFLYVTQWMFIKMGGSVYIERKKIILVSPFGRSWHSTDAKIESKLIEQSR